jgi:hypothetical protein
MVTLSRSNSRSWYVAVEGVTFQPRPARASSRCFVASGVETSTHHCPSESFTATPSLALEDAPASTAAATNDTSVGARVIGVTTLANAPRGSIFRVPSRSNRTRIVPTDAAQHGDGPPARRGRASVKRARLLHSSLMTDSGRYAPARTNSLRSRSEDAPSARLAQPNTPADSLTPAPRSSPGPLARSQPSSARSRRRSSGSARCRDQAAPRPECHPRMPCRHICSPGAVSSCGPRGARSALSEHMAQRLSA